ncbi:c-type cytochrome [Aliidiomarina quisquiliarum]|uniref:c-type cytochrome n=1 Tax=Aliidiomarina quisquiliarum TaxID=2938947 RepID=UPI00208EB53D|nr:c-type cytochrome [Aliidiomarina quisquiliarum]MCO4322587.1 c-type cytochrome [Aliidiomarina quisquiliarum]
MNKPIIAVAAIAVIAVAGWTWNESRYYDAPERPALNVVDIDGNIVGEYRAPLARDMLAEENAESIILGMRLLNETARLLPDNVGDGLNCNSCHMAQGKRPLGAPYINTINDYPKFMPRAQDVLNIQERINGCFRRSMNGVPLDESSVEMQAMVDYMDWLRGDVEKGNRVSIQNMEYFKVGQFTPDPVRGEQIYVQQCASCHGGNGEGMKDQFGDFIFPPLWGDESFNLGAGMARISRAAPFVLHNMPLGVSLDAPLGQITLSKQDAVDVSAYFTVKPRPDFPDKIHDWPGVPKPPDFRAH